MEEARQYSVVRAGHKLVLVLLAAAYLTLVGGLVGQAVLGGRVIQLSVAVFAWLRLGVEITRFQIAKREDLPMLRTRRIGIAMWLLMAVFITLVLNTTLIVGR